MDVSAWIGIAHCIICNIVKHFVKHMAYSLNSCRLSVIIQKDFFFLCVTAKIIYHILGKLIQFHTLHGNCAVLLFIQTGKLNNICHQISHTIGLLINSS